MCETFPSLSRLLLRSIRSSFNIFMFSHKPIYHFVALSSCLMRGAVETNLFLHTGYILGHVEKLNWISAWWFWDSAHRIGRSVIHRKCCSVKVAQMVAISHVFVLVNTEIHRLITSRFLSHSALPVTNSQNPQFDPDIPFSLEHLMQPRSISYKCGNNFSPSNLIESRKMKRETRVFIVVRVQTLFPWRDSHQNNGVTNEFGVEYKAHLSGHWQGYSLFETLSARP